MIAHEESCLQPNVVRLHKLLRLDVRLLATTAQPRGPVPVAYSAGASCPAVLNGVRAKIRRTIGSKDSSGSDA